MTRRDAPVTPPVVLTVAGSDSGGGAGIQADLKTIEAGGAFGTSAVTSVTAQHTRGVERSHVLPIEEIEAQIDAVLDDFSVAAVKTGMLGTADVVETVADYADAVPNLVVDPVMVATSGDRLLEPEAEDAYERLVAAATLVTPNADEAAVLTGVAVEDEASAREAGERLVESGADAALVKGGHLPGDHVVDTLVTGDRVRTYRHDRIDTDAAHGSGCMLSSAIAARLAHGDSLPAAVDAGVDLLSRAVRYNVDVGEGPGAVHHLVDARHEAAKRETVEAVESVVRAFVGRDAAPLVPADGADVVGATPYAETPADVAGVDGGLPTTADGVRPNRGVRFGAADSLARALVAAREVDPTLRYAVTCRLDERTRNALSAVASPVADATGTEGSLATRVGTAVADEPETPTAVVDPAAGTDGLAVLLASDADALADRVRTLLAELPT